MFRANFCDHAANEIYVVYRNALVKGVTHIEERVAVLIDGTLRIGNNETCLFCYGIHSRVLCDTRSAARITVQNNDQGRVFS